ncbi:shikimate kinase-domain-containing protein [Xylariales sp. PMI_506]|nr:shikimate kinase-domain-containing protein [Xylariales sp. PMI_506]
MMAKNNKPPPDAGGCRGIVAERSIFLIGMTGAGKTTTGNWLAQLLDREAIDLDHLLKERWDMPTSDIVRQFGWDEFRHREFEALQDVMQNRPNHFIVSCGGGVIETREARELLQSWTHAGGIVLHVHRNTDQMVDFLLSDKTRAMYTDRIREVYERRKPLLEECSNFYYLNHCPSKSSTHIPIDFQRFISAFGVWDITSRSKSEWRTATRNTEPGSGQELRLDLLQEPTTEIAAMHIASLRASTSLPITVSLRTTAEGGSFSESATDEAAALFRLASKMAVEYLAIPKTLWIPVTESLTSSASVSHCVLIE